MFVMTFFASNFIILISVVMLIAFVYRMVRQGKTTDGKVLPDDSDV